LPEPIPADVLERILETTCTAPSAHNRQPWRLVVITSPAGRESLAADMGRAYRRDLTSDRLPESEIEATVLRSYRRITSSQVAIVLCLDSSLGDYYPDPERIQAEYLMGVQSVALAGGVLLLAAHAEGIGGVWMCAPLFAPDVVKESLALQEEWQPQALILLGYPQHQPDLKSRQPISQVVKFI
jgi:F420 biosynthesis protein FbiB-like protein